MYGWIFRRLPGGFALKVVLMIMFAAVVAAGLLFGVFPVVEPHLPLTRVTVDE
ncbi:putative membrane protein [Candidatus Protofrankia californiensis]|uniref:Putative membrane protein n=1 Tax=Candidatus Protofrankia californiensis TaxID=1839754 RepID=A0A1C3NXQ8_9ACTN|nr:putative membrane protein [Candidatus Protofrankia californiensis]